MQQLTAAEEEVNSARVELAKARAKQDSFEATEQMPSYFDGTPKEFFTFLIEQVEKREAALEKREAALEKREAALIELSKLGIQNKDRSLPPSGAKRLRSSSASSQKSAGLTQASFRQKIVARDKTCVISGIAEEFCDAAHIVAKCNFAVNDFQSNILLSLLINNN